MTGVALVVVSGLPGTGKSMFADALAERMDTVHLSRDQMALSRRSLMDMLWERATGRRRDRLASAAGRRLVESAAAVLREGRSVVVEVVGTPDILRPLMQLAAAEGATVRSIELICSDPNEHLRRLQSRPGNWSKITVRIARAHVVPDGALVLDSTRPLDDLVYQAISLFGKEQV